MVKKAIWFDKIYCNVVEEEIVLTGYDDGSIEVQGCRLLKGHICSEWINEKCKWVKW